MFGRNPQDTPGQENNATAGAQSPVAARSPTEARAVTPAVPVSTRRLDLPTSNPRRSNETRNSQDRMDGNESRLIVGKGLSLSGEINACDVLVVEGKVEAKLSDGKLIEIAESGQFRGSVEIENADIAGRYEGDLTVRGRLTVRGTGRISGVIKYGELEVIAGGQIIGEMQVVGVAASSGATVPGALSTGGNNFKNAAKFTSASDDEDEAQPEQQQKSRKAS